MWGLLLIGGFSVAACLEPDPSGIGTHEQLGLPACTVREVFGVPCPSCGMTTSFAHFVRGQFVPSARANAGGFWLAASCAVQIPWSLFIALTGRKRLPFSLSQVLLVFLLPMMCLALIHWGFRILF